MLSSKCPRASPRHLFLTWAGELALEEGGSESPQPFNECLVIGYFENSHMGVSSVEKPGRISLTSLVP
jgi:hypothetical protein